MKGTRLISFSGPDGAGKTTQIRLILQDFENYGDNVVYIHIFSRGGSFFNRLVYSYKFFSRTVKNSKNKNRPSASKKRTILLLVKMLITVLDSWVTILYIRLMYRNKLVICDRYFYDSIAYIAAAEKKLTPIILRYSKLIPKPNTSILLYASPEVLFKRKKGQNLEALRLIDNVFKNLAAQQKLFAVSTEKGVVVVHNELKNIIFSNKNMQTAHAISRWDFLIQH